MSLGLQEGVFIIMDVSSMTYNGQQINPEGYLSNRKYVAIQFLLSKLSNLIGEKTTEPDIIDFQAEFSRSLHRFDSDLSIHGYLTCNYDKRLDSVTVPIKDQSTGEQYTVILKWARIGNPPKVQILD
jgi:hypothetical protein